jgi:hypothetical protein
VTLEQPILVAKESTQEKLRNTCPYNEDFTITKSIIVIIKSEVNN